MGKSLNLLDFNPLRLLVFILDLFNIYHSNLSMWQEKLLKSINWI